MHHYFKKEKDLQKAKKDLKGTIERIANECNIDVYTEFSVVTSLVIVWDGTAEFSISEEGVHRLRQRHPDLPLTKGWNRLRAKLKKELEK